MSTITSITPGQKEAMIRFATDALRKGLEVEIEELSKTGLHKSNFQKVLEGGDTIVAAVRIAVKQKITELASGIVGCLKHISLGEKISIPATTGKRTIAKADKVFTGYIDADFVNYGCDVEGAPALEIQTDVYELVENGDFRKIFGSFGLNLDLLCLTQDQIIAWVENNRKWLRTGGYGTFFLFKENGEFFVAYVFVGVVGALGVRVFRLSGDSVWDAGGGRRVVLPQLTPSVPSV